MIFLAKALTIVFFLYTAENILSEEPNEPIVWGKLFGNQMQWENINMSCVHNMKPVCCTALEDLDKTARDISLMTTRGL